MSTLKSHGLQGARYWNRCTWASLDMEVAVLCVLPRLPTHCRRQGQLTCGPTGMPCPTPMAILLSACWCAKQLLMLSFSPQMPGCPWTLRSCCPPASPHLITPILAPCALPAQLTPLLSWAREQGAVVSTELGAPGEHDVVLVDDTLVRKRGLEGTVHDLRGHLAAGTAVWLERLVSHEPNGRQVVSGRLGPP